MIWSMVEMASIGKQLYGQTSQSWLTKQAILLVNIIYWTH